MNTKVLFICHGNVGRSQIAEGFYNHITQSSHSSSAGVDPKTPEKWKTLAPEVLLVMKEEKIDLSSKKVKFVTEEMINETEKVIIMCKKEDCPNFVFKHKSIDFWKIEDPYGASIEGFRRTRDKIKKMVFLLIQV